jgi:signal transduction histidine kinase/CheY-like chemotaxis protein
VSDDVLGPAGDIAPGASEARIAAIAGAADAFNEAVPDMDALLSIVAEHISRATGDFCSVVLLSSDGKRIEPVAAFHPDPRVLRDATAMLGIQIELEAAGPWKIALGERRRVVIQIDPDHLPPNMAPHQAKHIKTWRMREAVMIPMIAKDTVVGGLNLSRMEGSTPLDEAGIELLESLASRAARAIANARLMQNQRLLASELESKVEERTKELTAANHAKSQFLANMSHELRTPLNAILGFSELLSDDVTGRFDEATRRRYLEQIHSSGKHLLQLINDILDLSKVEAGQVTLNLQPVEIRVVIDEIRATVEPLARIKSITLDTSASGKLLMVADSSKVTQMLLNLVSNAIKFTPSGGRIGIQARGAGSWIEIAVSDTGIGIAEADLGRLFTEFQQLSAGPGRQQQGTGLGLALTKRFAELHGGQVTVESKLGTGSTFTLRLPRNPGAKPSPVTTAPSPTEPVDLTRPLVLVVDDNAAAAEILARHLDAGGFRMAAAHSGQEALRMARELMPVAITLDILLPEIDGWEVLTRLKADEATRNIPVVVASVIDKPALGRALGAIDYFVKPVDAKALLSRLGQYTFTSKVKDESVRILAVDDERANLDVLQASLEPAGFAVLRAGGGREGIEMARSLKPDLILLDLMMPGVTGFDVVEALKGDEATRSIPIMVLTAKQLTINDKQALDGHVAGIFQRDSVAGTELTGWLRELIAKRQRA